MKTHKYLLGAFLLIGFCLFPFASHADMFGSDEKKWEKVFSDLKKISVRLTDNVDVQLKGLQASQAELLSQISNLKSAIPALQGAVEQNDAKVTQRLEKMDGQLAALETKVKMQLDDQKKSLQETANALRQGLAVDMDNLAKRNGEAQTATLAGLANMDTKLANADTKFASIDTKFTTIDANNKKMIEILAKTLQENQDASRNVGLLDKSLADAKDQVKVNRDMLTKLKEIFSAKLDSLAREQGVLHAQADSNMKAVDGNLKAIDGNLKVVDGNLKAMDGNLKVVDGNLKAIDGNLKVVDGNLKAVEGKIGQSTLKIDAGMANVDLANQKLSKLIEILKVFAVEQEKIVRSQAEMAKEQGRIGETQVEMAHTLSDIQGKLNSHPAKTEGKKAGKKEKAATSEGKHKKADD